MSEGTVLHEIQSLEKQLSRLMPTLEKFNSRISTIEADVRNIEKRLNSLKCDENQATLSDLNTELKTGILGLKKDIEALEKDVGDLDKATDAIQTDRKNEGRTSGNRIWGLVEKVIGIIVAAFIAWLALKMQGK